MFNWKRNKPEETPAPSVTPDRYDGRPLLMLLENYVLDCIGELSPEKQKNMISVVQSVFGGGEDWKQTLREVLHLDIAMDEQIKHKWQTDKGVDIAIQQVFGGEVLPEQFAQGVVDANFAHLIDAAED